MEELEPLGKDFIRSPTEHNGNVDSFLSKLAVLKTLTAEGVFSFGINEQDAYLAEYEQAGNPAVSHSPDYRDGHKSAYRIIRQL